MQGESYLLDQAVIVAQTKSRTVRVTRTALDDGAHFFSGGLGGLGLLTARLLVEGGARQLVLSSRSDRVVAGSEGDWEWIAGCRCCVQRIRCDVSEEHSVRMVLSYLTGEGLRFSGVFHAAHQLADGTIVNQAVLNFRTTYGPKVHGATAVRNASCIRI